MAKNPSKQQDSTIDLPTEEKSKKKLAARPFGNIDQVEMRSNEIEEGLSEIYQDEDGKIVNMKNAEIVHGHTWLYRIFIWLFNIVLIIGVAWTAYYYFHQYKSANDTGSIELNLDGPKKVNAGGEITYTVTYKNFDRIDLRNASVRLIYPEGFVFASAEPQPNQGQDFWTIGDIDKLRSGEIKIKGYLIGEASKNKIVLATLAYTPSNFSSEFKKDASLETVIESTGMDFSFDFPQSVLIGDQNDLFITYRQLDGSAINHFRLTVGKLDNLSFGTTTNPADTGIYQVSLSQNPVNASSSIPATATTTASGTPIAVGSQGELRIPLVFTSKVNNTENLNFNFEYSPDGNNYYSFFKKDIPVEVLVKSINLDLLINGSKEPQGVDFGQALNYTISYANKGDQPIKNLVVVAVLESDFLDWTTLNDKNKGKVNGDKIMWTQSEIPDLGSLNAGQEGTIDFTINVTAGKDINPVKNYQIKSYARYSLGDASSTPDTKNNDSNRSNTVINKINSNLDLSEQIRYFDDDNIAVGSGPQPPKVGQKTGYRVYWKLTNSLNELYDLKIETTLPDYVSFEDKNVTDLGAISYNKDNRKITWDIGKLKISATKAAAEFNISVTPTSTDINKIMVLLHDTEVTAGDNATNNKISKKLKAKTSRLIDDPAIVDDGRVVE